MVLRTCRAMLRDTHDAHDAFQATFLVLVRRAGSLWVRDGVYQCSKQVLPASVKLFSKDLPASMPGP